MNILIIVNYLLLLIGVLNASSIDSVIKSFSIEEVPITLSPFCIIRHTPKYISQQIWNDYYISFNKTSRELLIQKNNEEPQVIQNFQQKERFVLCYLSTVVENQITLVSLNSNFTQPGLIVDHNKFIGMETEFSVQTEYQYNITSKIMKNTGYPIRKTNNTEYTIRFSIQYEVLKNGNQIDFKQYGLSPIPNYDQECLIYVNETTQSVFIPNGYFFQYSNIYNKYYAQQFNVLGNSGGFATFAPTINDQYSIITASTITVTDNTFMMTVSAFQLLEETARIKIFNFEKEICTTFRYDLIQQINDEYLLITHQIDSFIIKREEFFQFFETKINVDDQNITYCYLKNETSPDLYYYPLGSFEINQKDWLGVIELQDEIESTKQYLLTQSVFGGDNTTLKNYTFYSIDLEQRTLPRMLDTSFQFEPIEGCSLYEGFTYQRGSPVGLTLDKLNRYALLYLVKGDSILKLQFRVSNNLQNNNNVLLSYSGIILSTLFTAFGFGQLLMYINLKNQQKSIRESIHRLNKISYLPSEKVYAGLIINLLSNVNEIYVFGEGYLLNECPISNNQIVLPNKPLMSMETNDLIFYSIQIASHKIESARKFIQLIKQKELDKKFNQWHYIFSEIKYCIEVQTEFQEKTFHKLIFAIQKSDHTLYSLKKFPKHRQHIAFDKPKNPIKQKQNLQDKNQDQILAVKSDEQELDTADIYLPELIILRKFTKALVYLKDKKQVMKSLSPIQDNIYHIYKNYFTINPLIIFYGLQQNPEQETINNQERKCLHLTEEYINYLQLTQLQNLSVIQNEKFKSFHQCLKFFDYHIDMREYFERFKEGALIGNGSYGDVKILTDKLNSIPLAVKIQNIMQDKAARIAMKELNTLKNISYKNEHCATKFYYGVISTDLQNGGKNVLYNRSYTIMEKGEKCLKSELEERIQNNCPFSDEELNKMFQELCSNLNIIHIDQQYIHGDISLDNILKISNQVYKFTDFGSANEIKLQNYSQTLSNFQFKQIYMCPEMIEQLNLLQWGGIKVRNIIENFILRKNNDLYALGLVFYQVVNFSAKLNKYSTKDECEIERKQKILKLNFQNQYSNRLIKGIQGLLNFRQIKDILQEFNSSE